VLLPAVIVALLSVLLVRADAADARYRVGFSEQSAEMFATPSWQALGLTRVRYLVPWGWMAGEQAEVDAYMTAARAHGQDVLVTFTAHPDCFDDGRYSRDRSCRAPGAGEYRAAFRAFDDRYPWVRTYSAWNEVNHVSQPTFGRPGLAARYYSVLRSEARRRGFRVLAADVLDTANMHRYLRAFLRRAPGRPRLWGLHNYQDVNDRTSADTRRMLRSVQGRVWLTETNGIVKFGVSRQFRYSEARAARRTEWLFTLAGRYDKRRGRLRSSIGRVYIHRWFGEPAGARFDAGVVDPDGSPRGAYYVIQRHVQRNAGMTSAP
jgi:hypothetical protein